ncbi:MAG: phosphatase PAP2 family protein [Ferruginibacter sp.]
MKKYILPVFIFISFLAKAQNDSALIKESNVFLNKNIAAVQTENKAQKKNCALKSYIIPTVFIGYGFASMGHNSVRRIDLNTKTELREDHSGFVTKVDNYLQYSPAVAVYALNAFGIKGENNFRDRTMIYALTTVISSAAVLSLKSITKVERPDGSGNNSFPSGHTTTAFAAAAFLQHEYKNVSPWYGIAGYAAATATGVIRLYNNKHWVSDVVAGAGVGILSTKLSYLIYPAIKRKLFKNKSINAVVVPYYKQHSGGLSMVYNFHQ